MKAIPTAASAGQALIECLTQFPDGCKSSPQEAKYICIELPFDDDYDTPEELEAILATWPPWPTCDACAAIARASEQYRVRTLTEHDIKLYRLDDPAPPSDS